LLPPVQFDPRSLARASAASLAMLRRADIVLSSAAHAPARD
jgi:hypothetical protein